MYNEEKASQIKV